MKENSSHIELEKGRIENGNWMKIVLFVLTGIAVLAVLLIAAAGYLESTQSKRTLADEAKAEATETSERPEESARILCVVTNMVARTVLVNMMVDRPVTNFIERTVLVEVEVEKPVTNVVVRPYEVTVDYPVTNVVVKPHLVMVEMPVTNVVVQPYEVTVDYPVTNLVVQPYEIQVDVPVTNMVLHQVDIVIDQVVTNVVRLGATRTVEEGELPAVRPLPAQAPRTGTLSVRKPIRLSTSYRVRYGDTVGGLAVKYGFRIPDFKVYNPNVDIECIKSGQMIQLPGDLTIESEE